MWKIRIEKKKKKKKCLVFIWFLSCSKMKLKGKCPRCFHLNFSRSGTSYRPPYNSPFDAYLAPNAAVQLEYSVKYVEMGCKMSTGWFSWQWINTRLVETGEVGQWRLCARRRGEKLGWPFTSHPENEQDFWIFSQSSSFFFFFFFLVVVVVFPLACCFKLITGDYWVHLAVCHVGHIPFFFPHSNICCIPTNHSDFPFLCLIGRFLVLGWLFVTSAPTQRRRQKNSTTSPTDAVTFSHFLSIARLFITLEWNQLTQSLFDRFLFLCI